MRLRICGLDQGGPTEVRDRLIEFFQFEILEPQEQVRNKQTGLQADRLEKSGQGLLISCSLIAHQTQVGLEFSDFGM